MITTLLNRFLKDELDNDGFESLMFQLNSFLHSEAYKVFEAIRDDCIKNTRREAYNPTKEKNSDMLLGELNGLYLVTDTIEKIFRPLVLGEMPETEQEAESESDLPGQEEVEQVEGME